MAHSQTSSWTPTAQGVEIRAPFRPAFRDAMRALPYRERHWVGTYWWVSWDCADLALEALQACFPDQRVPILMPEEESENARA